MSGPLVIHESDVDPVHWSDPVRGEVGFRTVFGAPGTTNPDFTAGVTELGPEGWLGHHRHDPAELYYVVDGSGTLTVDGAEHAVRAGTAVYVPGGAEHGIRNTGAGPLRFFYAFAVGSFDEIEYRFSADDRSRLARVEDVHDLALRMPHVTVERGTADNPVYQVGGKSFVFFRNPRPDAVDPETGERYRDVIVLWVPSEADKQALVQDDSSPFFSTPHFDGHPSVLLRGAHVGELSLGELEEVVQEAWLSRASARRAAAWLAENPTR